MRQIWMGYCVHIIGLGCVGDCWVKVWVGLATDVAHVWLASNSY